MRKLALTAVAILCGVACGGSSFERASPQVGIVGGDCSASSSGPKLTPVNRAGASGTIALADQAGRTLAFVADEDDHALHVLDVAQKREVSTVPLAGAPSQVLVTSDGRVLVTIRDASLLQVFTSGAEGTLRARCNVEAGVEPIALAESPDSSSIVMTHGFGHVLDVLRGRDLVRLARVELPREPRGVIVSDGNAVVSHVLGSSVSVVDLRTFAVRRIDTRGAAEERTITVKKRGLDQRYQGNGTESRVSSTRRPSLQGYALAKMFGRIISPARPR